MLNIHRVFIFWWMYFFYARVGVPSKLILYGSFAKFVAVTIAAITGAGKMMSIAGGKEGTPVVEGLISFLLITLALAMIFVCVVVLTGLYRNMKRPYDNESNSKQTSF